MLLFRNSFSPSTTLSDQNIPPLLSSMISTARLPPRSAPIAANRLEGWSTRFLIRIRRPMVSDTVRIFIGRAGARQLRTRLPRGTQRFQNLESILTSRSRRGKEQVMRRKFCGSRRRRLALLLVRTESFLFAIIFARATFAQSILRICHPPKKNQNSKLKKKSFFVTKAKVKTFFTPFVFLVFFSSC